MSLSDSATTTATGADDRRDNKHVSAAEIRHLGQTHSVLRSACTLTALLTDYITTSEDASAGNISTDVLSEALLVLFALQLDALLLGDVRFQAYLLQSAAAGNAKLAKKLTKQLDAQTRGATNQLAQARRAAMLSDAVQEATAARLIADAAAPTTTTNRTNAASSAAVYRAGLAAPRPVAPRTAAREPGRYLSHPTITTPPHVISAVRHHPADSHAAAAAAAPTVATSDHRDPSSYYSRAYPPHARQQLNSASYYPRAASRPPSGNPAGAGQQRVWN